MKKSKGFIGVILISMTCTWASCLFDSDTDKITGKYVLRWIDVESDRKIAKRVDADASIGLTEPYVFGVGHSSDFIIGKRHPVIGGRILRDSIDYLIVDIRDERDSVYAPLNKHQFDSLRQQFKIEDVTFDQTYDE